MSSNAFLTNAVGTKLYLTGDVQNWSLSPGSDGNVHGGAMNDYLQDPGGGHTLTGGASDDTYLVGNGTMIIEQPNGGTDLAYSYLPVYVLPANVENLITGVANAWGIGNSQDNIITGAAAGQILSGGAGNDILIGGEANTTFIVRAGEGSDLITDFHAGAGGDKLRLDNYGFKDFAAVQGAMTQSGADTILHLPTGETLTLQNTHVGDFTAANYLAPVNLQGLHLTFSDDFNSLSLLDPTTGLGTWKTNYDYAGYNQIGSRTLPSNGEKQIYSDAAFQGTSDHALGLNPFTISNGVLGIHADSVAPAVSQNIWGYQYTSGSITTSQSFAQEYGYFDIRAQAPSGQGLWPCIWLLPTDGTWPPEIDILESIGDASQAHETAHTNDGGFNSFSSSVSHLFPTDDGFHNYGLSWTADEIIWYVDGQEVKRIATPSDYHKPMYLLINLAVGGSWPGDPDPSTPLHTSFNIDYVHVYSYDNADSTTAPATLPVKTSAPAAAPADPVATPAAPTPDPTPAPPADPVAAPVVDTHTTPAPVIDTSHPATTTVVDTTHTSTAPVVDTPSKVTASAVDTSHTTAAAAPTDDGLTLVKGTAGGDWLDGSAGHQKLVGGAGDDFYWVTSTTDVVVEAAGEGYDTVQSTVSWTLGSNIEKLILGGSADIDGTGNDLGNTLMGNSGANHLTGGAGNDYIDGGAGADVMAGGAGDDYYVVDNVGDQIVEAPNAGHDRVMSSVSFTLPANVEDLALSGTANINATGNELGNVIEGNAGDNVITGGGGADYMTGAGGADTFVFAPGSGKDVIGDFSAAQGDIIDLTAYHNRTHTVTQAGGDVLIDFGGGDSITVIGAVATNTAFQAHIHW